MAVLVKLIFLLFINSNPVDSRKYGFKIAEEPITWHDMAGSKVSLKAYLSVFKDLFKVRWWLWTGKYKINK